MNRLLGVVIALVVIIIIAALLIQTPSTTPAPTSSPTPTTTPSPTTPVPTPTSTPTPQPTTPTPTITQSPTPTPTTRVAIKIWHALNPEEESVFRKIVSEYMKINPNVQIIFENKAPDLQTAVLAAIATGEKFDLFIWAHDWIGIMVETGVLRPVDQEVADVLNKFAVPIPQHKGSVYGLPFTAETVALICNTKMVKSPPRSFPELLGIMRQYHNPPRTYGMSYVVNPYFISAWIHGAGGYYFDDKTEKQGLSDPRSLAGFQFFKQYVMPYVGPNPTDYNTQISLFLAGQTPCMVNGPWAIGAVKRAGIEFFVAPLPPVNESYVPRPYGGLKMFYVTKYASKEAIEFMKWFTTDFGVAKVLEDSLGYVPVLKDYKPSSPVVNGFFNALQHVYLMPVSPKMQPVWGAVDIIIQNAIVSDQVPLAQAVQEAARSLCARGLC